MKVSTSGLLQNSPAKPLLLAQVSYQGTTDQIGNAFGTTLQDTRCSTAGQEPSYAGQIIKLLSGDAAGQIRPIAVHNIANGILTVVAPFTDFNGVVYPVPAGTQFVILSSGGGGGPPPPAPPAPSVGLWMFGHVDPAMAAGSLNTFACPNLAGFEDDLFNTEFWIQIIHNDDAAGTAPEREIRRVLDYVGATGTFTTDPFSAVVEADDLLCLFHESLMGVEILGFGTLTVSSTTVPADGARAAAYAWENNNYFRGNLLLPTEGDCRFQPRLIVEYTSATGVFTIDPNNPLSQAPGLVDYVIIRFQTQFVPAADGTNNRTPADVTGNKASTPIWVPDDVSDQIRYLKGILTAINAGLEPTRSVMETWQDVLGINPNIWTVTNPATGAAWARGESGGFLYAESTPNANEVARIRSVQQWIHSANTPNLNLIIKKTILEFELLLGVPANLDNTLSFFGFTNIAGATRASDNLIGFGLLADVLQTITDSGSAETVATGFGEDLTLHNKFRIEIYEGNIDWYLNEVLIANSATNIPTVPCHLNFFTDLDAGGPSVIDLGIVKCWYEMVERY